MRPLFARIRQGKMTPGDFSAKRPASVAIRSLLGVLLAALIAPCAVLAAEDIGKVIAFTPGVSVLREGMTEGLALHAGIRVADTVRTDATGRVKILFNDDSSVSLGSNTTMEMSEYADAGARSAFGVKVPQGVIRAITGKIVDQNPDGFRMTSPEASVGIRGTIVSMRVARGVTTVYVENTLRRVYVNNINVPSGNKITLPGDRTEPIQPEDRRQLGSDLALRGGSGVAAAAPEPGGGGVRRPATEQLQAGQVWNELPPDTPLKDIALATQSLAASLAGPGPVNQLTGTVSGTLITSGMATGTSGTFSFSVNLGNGNISNGEVFLSGPAATAVNGSWTGGTGSASALSWGMMTPQINTATLGGIPLPNAYVDVYGFDDLKAAPSGTSSLSSGVDYRVYAPGVVDSGSGSGTITKP